MFDYLPQQALPYVVDIPHLTDGRRIGPDDETARDHRFEHRPGKHERIGEIGGPTPLGRSSPRKDAPGAARPAEVAGTPGWLAQPRNRDVTGRGRDVCRVVANGV